MVTSTSWCELARFDDLPLARAVATSIAAMEFDVQLHDPDQGAGDEAIALPRRTRYVVEVDGRDRAALADVLQEIIDEQEEFDRALARRQSATEHAGLVIIITMTGAADILLMLGLLEL
ncbi:MAG: hypothetical protein ACYS0G_10450 [Planctomycetota bacterium]|jgi:hypothetical protein